MTHLLRAAFERVAHAIQRPVVRVRDAYDGMSARAAHGRESAQQRWNAAAEQAQRQAVVLVDLAWRWSVVAAQVVLVTAVVSLVCAVVVASVVTASVVSYAALYNWLLPTLEHHYDLVLDLSNRSHCVAATLNLDRHLRGDWHGTHLVASSGAAPAMGRTLMPGVAYDVVLDVQLTVPGGTTTGVLSPGGGSSSSSSSSSGKFYRTGHVEVFAQLCTGPRGVVPVAQCSLMQEQANFLVAQQRSHSPFPTGSHELPTQPQQSAACNSDGSGGGGGTAHTGAHGHGAGTGACAAGTTGPTSAAGNCTSNEAPSPNAERDGSCQCTPPRPSPHGNNLNADVVDSANDANDFVLAYDYNSLTTTLETMPWMDLLHEMCFVVPNMLGWLVGYPNLLGHLRGACRVVFFFAGVPRLLAGWLAGSPAGWLAGWLAAGLLPAGLLPA